MSKNAMAGAVTMCGVGLCVIGAALMMQNGNSAHAAGGMPLAAVAAVAHAQAGPTVVWYQIADGPQTVYPQGYVTKIIYRAWSDGTLESRVRVLHLPEVGQCEQNPNTAMWFDPPYCGGGWRVISSPTDGFRAAADINADEKIDGVDLASILGNWGDAPRVPFPPSDCPLNLINP